MKVILRSILPYISRGLRFQLGECSDANSHGSVRLALDRYQDTFYVMTWIFSDTINSILISVRHCCKEVQYRDTRTQLKCSMP